MTVLPVDEELPLLTLNAVLAEEFVYEILRPDVYDESENLQVIIEEKPAFLDFDSDSYEFTIKPNVTEIADEGTYEMRLNFTGSTSQKVVT